MENEIMSYAENYRDTNEGGSIKEIILRQFQKVVANMSKEFRAGYMIYDVAPNRNRTPLRYVGDTRDDYKNSLDCLHDILQPMFDDEMKKASEEIYETINEIIEADDQKTHWKKLLPECRKLFQALSFFLQRINWLETKDIEE